MNTLKKAWIVVAGFLTVVVLSVVTDMILEKIGLFPKSPTMYLSSGLSLIALAYRTLYTILGGYVTASLAPANRKDKYVMVLGIMGTVAGLAGVASTWGKNLGPEWYPIGLAVLAYPSVWLGGKLKK